MHRESGRKTKPMSADFNNNLKLKGCGLINCRSRLGARNSVRKEIQQILMDRFRCDGWLDSKHPASHRGLSK